MDSRRSAQIKRIKRRGSCIPDELSSEILSRLPVRSVIRFRCVCKLWRSITNDPKFIDAHLDHARKADPPSILLFLTRKNWGRYGVAIIHHDSRAPKRILWWPTHDFGHLSGSCNGLLCIYHRFEDGSITVLNPATMESLTLPEHTITGTPFPHKAFLGFHPETKEYKVVRFFWLSTLFLTACEVHTLGTSSWRRIAHPHNCFPDDPATVDGVMHWAALDDKGLIALSFDLKVEKFTSIPFPDSSRCTWTNLVELQGSVCLPIFPKDARSLEMEIWMLIPSTDENDNLKHEWGLKYSGISLGCSSPRLYVHQPLFIHGDKVLTYRSKRVVWDGTMSGLGNDGMDDPGTLIYYRLKSKGEGTIGEVFYRLVDPTIPPIFNYLEGQHHLDEDPYGNNRIRCSEPFVHVESLVSLRNR